MVFGKEALENKLKLEERIIENVEEFTYLGSVLTWDNNCTKDISTRIAKAKGILAGFNNIWRSKSIRHKTKLGILRTCVWSVALYASETWTLKKTDQGRLLAFEMYCYRRMLRISWRDRVTNEEIRRRLNLRENIVQMIIKRKLNFFGHICRMRNDRKVKTVMLGEMEGTGRRGRPNREWLDDIRDWCQKDIQSLSRETEDRGKWKMIVKSALDTYGLSAHGH